MDNMKTRSLGARMLVGLAVVMVLGAIAVQSFGRISEASAEEWRHAERRTVWAYQISQLRENVATQRAEQLAMLTAPDAQQTILETSIRQRAQDISRIINDFHSEASEQPQLSGNLTQLADLYSTVRHRENLQILPGLRDGKAAESRALLLGAQQKDFNRLQDMVKDLADKMEQSAMSEAAASTAATRSAQRSAMAVAILCMVVAAAAMTILPLAGPRVSPARS